MEPSRSKATSTATRSESTPTSAARAMLCVACAIVLALAWGCGASHSDSSGAQAGTSTGGTPVQTSGGAGAAAGGTTHAGGAASAAGTPSSGGTGSGGVLGGSSGVPPACTFETPQCPNTHAACAGLGVVQNCFVWQTCHSAPGQMVCCDSGWEPGQQCPGGAGGAGGAGGDACGGCDPSSEICVYQLGGPGTSRYTCAQQSPCAAAGVCACIVDQGNCTYQASGTPAACVCDNGLD